jgi:hypothetical protein
VWTEASFVSIVKVGVVSLMVAPAVKLDAAKLVSTGADESSVKLTAAVAGDAVALPCVSTAWQATW